MSPAQVLYRFTFWKARLAEIADPYLQLQAAAIVWFDKLSLLPFNLTAADAYFRTVVTTRETPHAPKESLMQALIKIGYRPLSAARRLQCLPA